MRRARRARQMMRRLEELDRLDARYGLGASPHVARRTPRREWLPYVVTPLVLLGLVLVIPGAMPAKVKGLIGLAPDRLAPAVEATSSGAHAYLHARDGSGKPVTWDPCKPIRYRINPDGGPPDAVALVQSSVAEVERLTGLVFEYAGTTDDRPQWDRPFIPTFRSPKRPALVSWATEREVKELSGDVAGVGGAAAVTNDFGHQRLMGGGVTLDIDSFAQMESWPEGKHAQRAVILHEFGHLVGLGHVGDEGELMHPSGAAGEFGPGDREGLAALGRGECS